MSDLFGVLLYFGGGEQFPRGPVPCRFRHPFFLAEDKYRWLVLADLPQDLNGLSDGNGGSLHKDGRFIINKSSEMSIEFRPVDRKPGVPDQDGGQENSQSDPEVKKHHTDEERIEKGEVTDDHGGQGKKDPAKHTQCYPLVTGHIFVYRGSAWRTVYKGGSANPSLSQFLEYFLRVLPAREKRDESCSIFHVEAHFTLSIRWPVKHGE